MAGFYRIKVPEDAKTFLEAGHDTLIIGAESSAEAILTAKAYLHLPSDAAWASATPVLLADPADLVGWRLKITITDTDDSVTETVTVPGVTVADFDSIGALAATALNATDSIAGAAYATPNLKVAETTDALGDQTVSVEFLPPTTWDDPTINFPAFYGTITHEGAEADALNVVLNDVVTPVVLYQLGS